MSELYKFRAFLNTLDCSSARDSSVSGYIDFNKGNNYSPPSLDGEVRIRDCGNTISLDFNYTKRRKEDGEDANAGNIGYEDSIQKFDLLISHLEQMKKAFLEGKKHVDELMPEWEKKQEEKKKKPNEENKTSV